MSLAMFAEIQALKAQIKALEARIVALEKPLDKPRPVLTVPKREAVNGN